MNNELKQLLIDCANKISAYDDGGNKATELSVRLDTAIDNGQNLPIHDVVCVFCGEHTDGNSFNEDAEPCHLSCLEKQEDYENQQQYYKDLIGY